MPRPSLDDLRVKQEDSRSDERDRVLALLRVHGFGTTSFQALEAGFRYWFAPGGDAVVAFVDTGGAWVAAGAPIAPAARLAAAASAFVAAARAARRRACFFAAEPRFSAIDGFESLPIGEQPSWSPARWPEIVRGAPSLREQLRRARAKGVRVRAIAADEVSSEGSELRAEMQEVAEAWLASRKMARMGFLVAVELFSFAHERRYFVAERGGRVEALLVAVPIYARRGWFFEDLLRRPGAPNGTNELLVDAAMRHVAEEGAERVTLGLAPLAGEVPRWLALVRDSTRALYDFEGLRRFKERFRPTAWEAIHLAWPSGGTMPHALHDALHAFTMSEPTRGASFTRFGLATLGIPPRLAR